MAARLARLVGTDRARELILLGTVLDGERAERIGLVNQVVPGAELEAAGLAWATRIAGLPRPGVRTTMEYLALPDGRSRADPLRPESARVGNEGARTCGSRGGS